MQNKIIQVQERVPFGPGLALSFQHLFAMFGASVLVPILFGIDPGIVLLMNGFGTLLFILLTKGKAPAYLGSSFAFISPTLIIIGSGAGNYPLALGGFVVVGLAMAVVAIIIKFVGTKWIDVVLPPAAMGRSLHSSAWDWQLRLQSTAACR
jgi:uracil permease